MGIEPTCAPAPQLAAVSDTTLYYKVIYKCLSLILHVFLILSFQDWWTKSRFSNYFRAWNRVVHAWLRDHIYRPIAPVGGRAIATVIVFLVSILHFFDKFVTIQKNVL